ncbi:MAG: hypothetical protein PHD78_02995 [Bacilli bacterium]|nr:hypothetical protein [Bacilli bacterium]MDD4054168.1 hypothetical protein [Bacilli bacterium]MDD4411998.1 hypothetical protein [Bacilli bacterium]
MKKIFVLLLIFPFVLMGCTVVEVNDKDLNKIVDTILGKNLNLHNQTSNGYKYYLPRGTRVIDSTSYNEKLFSDGYKYYLYVDIVNYHFKKDVSYEENMDAYFSKKLDYNKKQGYLEITEIKNLYFVEMMYNYSKIEVFVSKDNIKDAVINASYILSSLNFNDTIIETLFNETSIDLNEEKFKLFEPKREEGNFLDYVKEYDQYEDTIDEDLIAPDDTAKEEKIIDDSLE